ncbi:hypothetical protein J437_LFUL002593 [Ladona fulva]|uniref:Protein kinase domain-containing protein n=1 Tax=Ladona fulva TaxID=123851 RepID=A0A8K0JVE3_LADFU|nr:hypothetical protein J437_LFUL002593 [Ladona fulva]
MVLYFTIDILNTVKHLHNIDIIHGAIKPENLLLRNFPNVSRGWTVDYFAYELPTLQLTNLAKSIDLTFFPKNARFICSKSTDRYQCIEMQNGLPWSFHADLYGIAFTIHCMIFGEYMDLNCRNGTWDIIRKIPRHFNAEIWNSVFHSLINVSSEKFPDLYQMQSFLQEALLTVKFEEFKLAVSNMKLLIEEDIIKKKPWLMGIS